MNERRIVLSIAFTILLMVSTSLPIVNTRAADLSTQTHETIETNYGTDQLPPFAPGVVLIGLKQGVVANIGIRGAETTDLSLNKTFARFGVRDIEPVFSGASRAPLTASAIRTGVDLGRIYRLRLPPDANVLQIVQELSAHPAVEYAEPDYLAHIITTPNDPEYSSQWGLAKINAPATWDVITGTTDLVIAIVDAGIDVTHPDLSGQLWQNPGEIAGNGIDDDNNGYVDDIHGWNLVNNNADLSDNTSHGTEVAGVAAAATNNSMGIAGVCWQCRLMVVKVVQPGGVANYSDIAAGVAYAAQKGAKVINISLGGNSDSITLKTAIANAAQTAVVVAGAGNDNSSAPFYPAAYDDYVLAVAGTTQTDAKVGTSNYGTWVDVSAPGEDIRTTFAGGGYSDASGTSVAAPFISGLVGLLRSQNPTWSASLTRAQIVNTTDNIDSANPGFAGQLGSGRINAQKAVTTAAIPQLSIVSYTVNGITSGTPAPGDTVNLVVTVRNTWGTVTNATGTLSTSDPYVTLTNASASYGSIDAYTKAANITPFVFSVSSSAPYAHAMAFTLTINGAGGVNAMLPLTITTQSGTLEVGGPISSNTIWTSDKTYYVTDNVVVLENITLTIQAGTVVKFAPGKSLLIGGTLIANGSAHQPIVFTSARATPAPGDWGLIKFGDTAADALLDANNEYLAGSILRYVRVEYANGVALMESMPYISHVTFYRNAGTHEGEIYWSLPSGALWRRAYSGRSGTFVVRNSVFIENQGGGLFTYVPYGGAGYIVNGNQFLNNRDAAMGFAFGGSGVPFQIVSNVLSGNGGGIFISSDYGCNGLIQDNTISGSNKGAYFPGYGIDLDTASPLIRHNLFAYHISGGDWQYPSSVIFARDSSVPTVLNNTFIANRTSTIVCFACDYAYNNLNEPGVYLGNNWESNEVEHIFRRGISSNWDIDAVNNYWGTTDPARIHQLIYDYYDDLNPGKVLFQPFLTEPDASAPAYLQQIEISPNPVGIETLSLTLRFSAPMDQSINPVVAFGTTSPYTSYTVLDNAQWISETVWYATYDITSLVPRDTYTISVGGARGTDGMEIPTDTRFSFVVDYAGQITDQTPPNAPSVIAGGKEGDASTVEASWWASDPDSPITSYRYAIGSAPGATDIVNWTATSNNFFTKTGLGLIEGKQYWVSVQARNIGGLWSASGYSAFVAGQPIRKVFLPLILRGQ